MVLLLTNATATFICPRRGTDGKMHDFKLENVDVLLGSTLGMAMRDPVSTHFQHMLHWDNDYRVDDGSEGGSPIQQGDAVENLIDLDGRPWYTNLGRIPLDQPRLAVGIGLDVAMAYIVPYGPQ